MKSTQALLTAMLTDVGMNTNTSMDRDLMRIRSRIKDEGLSFLTITLPSFSKDLDRCLENGYYDPSLFRAFCKVRGSVRIPKLFSGILSQIFDCTGRLHTNVNPDLVDGVRQICLSFNKLKKGCTDDRQAKAVIQYQSCEDDLRTFRPNHWSNLNDFRRCARIIFGKVFARLQLELSSNELIPKHGPGAVAEYFSLNGKYSDLYWSKRLERTFPIVDYALPNYGHSVDDVLKNAFTSRTELPVRVVFVPKTQKTPRVIAIEPAHNQYAQQAISGRLMQLIESDEMCKGIHFTSNEFNREFARKSSVTRKYATLDLSEASDRVHAGLVFHLLGDYSLLRSAIFDCRSKYALLPNGKTVGLKKFSSMGSALCFPIESMVFYTICILSGLRAGSLPVQRRHIDKLINDVHVFGDDLIVPVPWCVALTDILESARFKVNTSKSFSLGPFRESCGMDAYEGYNITPVYFRQEIPKSRKEHSRIVALIASRNQFYKKGFWATTRCIDDILGRFFDLHHTCDTSPSVGLHSFLNWRTISRWNSSLHRFEFRGLVPVSRERVDRVNGVHRLLKYFLRSYNSTEPVEVRDFNTSTVRDSVVLKSRWIPS